jgi:hypothetical protein
MVSSKASLSVVSVIHLFALGALAYFLHTETNFSSSMNDDYHLFLVVGTCLMIPIEIILACIILWSGAHVLAPSVDDIFIQCVGCTSVVSLIVTTACALFIQAFWISTAIFMLYYKNFFDPSCSHAFRVAMGCYAATAALIDFLALASIAWNVARTVSPFSYRLMPTRK